MQNTNGATEIMDIFQLKCCVNVDHLIFTVNRTNKCFCSSYYLQHLDLHNPQDRAPCILLWAVLPVEWQLFGTLCAHRFSSSHSDSHRHQHQPSVGHKKSNHFLTILFFPISLYLFKSERLPPLISLVHCLFISFVWTPKSRQSSSAFTWMHYIPGLDRGSAFWTSDFHRFIEPQNALGRNGP